MRVLLLTLVLVMPALSARADPVVDRVTQTVALPALDRFAAATAALSQEGARDCLATSEPLRAAYQAAFDAWIDASAYRAGPMEQDGRNLAIAFWPDPKGSTPQSLKQLLSGSGALLQDGQSYGRASVAARGLFGLEAMLYDPAFNSYGPDDPGCRLVRAAAQDLAITAGVIAREWVAYADLLQTAGAPGNPRFLSEREARQYFFTSLLGVLQFAEEVRLTRPLGTPERPRPERAEALDAGRPLRNIRLSLDTALVLATALTGEQNASAAPVAEALDAINAARDTIAAIDDPLLAGVSDPEGRARLEALRSAIHLAREQTRVAIGADLGVSAGFNSLDGD